MSAALHHAMLGVACVALFTGGHRLATKLSDSAADRLLAATALAVAAAVVEALLLGLFGLGSDTLALTVAAVATAIAVVLAVPRPAVTTAALISGAASALSRRERAVAGALAATAALLVVWPLIYPLLGFDGAVYHLPEVVGWVNSGKPAAIEPVSYLFPFANYPITNEVTLTWLTGIAQSLVPVFIWAQFLFLISAFAGFVGLRALQVPRWLAALAAATLLATPVCIAELGTPSTDVAALCWLLCAGALTARAREHPRLLTAALVAAGLAAGTKTTALPYALLIVAAAGWRLRRALRPQALALGLAAVAAIAVGGLWYLRNAATHGSPLWPFRSLPGGDPVPHVWSLIEPSLLQRPDATVSPRTQGYLEAFAGALLLFTTAGVAWIAARTRAVVVASTVAVGGLLLWAAAPSTGQPDTPVFDVNVVSTTRYALPAVAAAALAVALAGARGTPLVRRGAGAVLVVALVLSLIRDAQIGHHALPYAWALCAAAGLGAAVGFLVLRTPTVRVDPRHAAAGFACAVVALSATLALPADGLLSRHVDAVPGVPGAALTSWALRQRGFAGSEPIYFTGTVYGQLAGERLQHDLVLLPPDIDCPALRAKAATGFLVVGGTRTFQQLGVPTPAACLAGLHPSYRAPGVAAYGRLGSQTSGADAGALAAPG